MRRLVKIVLILLISINVLYVVSGVIHFPLRHVDVYSIWLFKAKAFYVYQEFPLSLFQNISYSHPQYPILLPWLYSLIYKTVGVVKEIYVLALYPFIYVSILYCAYKFFIKLGLKSNQSLLFTYIYSMLSPLLAQAGREHAGMADIILTLLYWIAINMAFRLKENNKFLPLGLFALTVIASQIKLEGLFMVVLFIFIPIKNRNKVFWMSLSLIPTLLWFYIRNKFAIPSDFTFIVPSLTLFLKRLTIVVFEVIREMVNIRNWYIFWIVFWLTTVIQHIKDVHIKRLINPSLIVISLLFLGVYLVGEVPMGTRNYVSSSADRVILQLSPFIFSIFVHKVHLIVGKVFTNKYLS